MKLRDATVGERTLQALHGRSAGFGVRMSGDGWQSDPEAGGGAQFIVPQNQFSFTVCRSAKTKAVNNSPFSYPPFSYPPFSVWEIEQDLVRGKRYQVIQAFEDASGQIHPAGEEWVFLESAFFPHDLMELMHIQLAADRDAVLPLFVGRQRVANHILEFIQPADG